jgi:hypothetical protein
MCVECIGSKWTDPRRSLRRTGDSQHPQHYGAPTSRVLRSDTPAITQECRDSSAFHGRLLRGHQSWNATKTIECPALFTIESVYAKRSLHCTNFTPTRHEWGWSATHDPGTDIRDPAVHVGDTGVLGKRIQAGAHEA